MKSFLSIITLTLFIFSAAQLNQPQTWKDFELAGKVENVEEISISKNKQVLENYSLYFNIEGNITKKENSYDDSKMITSFTYDSKGRQEEIHYLNYYKEKLTTESTMILKYSNDSIFVSTDIADNEKKTNKSFTAIVKDGLIVKYYGEKKGESRLIEYAYDNHNNIISQTRYKNGEISNVYREEYEYDANGIVLKKTSEDQSSTIEYLPNGLTKSYNEFTYEYIYDSTGNWIKKTTFKNGKKFKESTRTIGYFQEK